MPTPLVIEITPPEQARLRAELRRARRGHWLTLHIVLLLALHYSPSEIAALLLCARSTVYRATRDWQAGDRGRTEQVGPRWPCCLAASVRRRLWALLPKTPAAYGWRRTRWSCATLALPLQTQPGLCVSAETVRRALHALGWAWKRAKLVAKARDPERASQRARIRAVYERLGRREARLFADELDRHLRPKVGAQWMPQASPVAVLTPGQQERRSRAGPWMYVRGKCITALVSQDDRTVLGLVAPAGPC